MYFQIHSRKSPDGGRKHSNKAEKNESLETIQLFFSPIYFQIWKLKNIIKAVYIESMVMQSLQGKMYRSDN